MVKTLLIGFSHLQRQLHKVQRPRLRAALPSKETEASRQPAPHLVGLSGFLTLIQSRVLAGFECQWLDLKLRSGLA
jgi:hypothetical protein